VSSDIFDVDGTPLAWRYISKVKGNITKEYYGIYLETIIHPSLGRPKPRTTHHGQQGVVIWDGVGTHLGYAVVMKALDLGLEILVRVPHLSHIFEGEDTVNFKELKAHWRRLKTLAYYSKINEPSDKYSKMFL
jgi:hypothetical protein